MPSRVLQVSGLDALTRIVLNTLRGLHLGILVGLASNLILGGWASWWALLTLLMWAHLFYQYKATSYIYLFRVSSIVSPGMLWNPWQSWRCTWGESALVELIHAAMISRRVPEININKTKMGCSDGIRATRRGWPAQGERFVACLQTLWVIFKIQKSRNSFTLRWKALGGW
jgi:hypothetical protein